MTKRPTYALTLRALPDRDNVPPIVRMRRLLKHALRSCGMRCVSICEVPADTPTEPSNDAADAPESGEGDHAT